MRKRSLVALFLLIIQFVQPTIIFSEINIQKEEELEQELSSNEEINDFNSDKYSNEYLFEKEASIISDSSESEEEEPKQETKYSEASQQKCEIPEVKSNTDSKVLTDQGIWGTVPWIYDDSLETITLYGGEAGEVADAPWKIHSSIKQIIVEDQVILQKNSERLFAGLRNLETIENTDRLNVKDVENMGFMFSYVENLRELNMQNWNTSSVTNMEGMFSGARSLNKLDLNNWDTSNVTNLTLMFSEAFSLETLEANNWDTSNVTNMTSMFQNARSITKLDVSDWDTSSVRFMISMFNGASSLTKLDVKGWDTSMVASVQFMFNYTYSLKTIVLGEKSVFSISRDWGGLPEIETNDQYSGRWVLEESLSSEVGIVAFENSTDLMNNYDGSHPGTYIWEVKNVNPVDPLAPEIEVEPDNKPEVAEGQGLLSIDFVSQLNFGKQSISDRDQTYYAQPQRLLNEDGTVNETEKRPNYVQISDRRQENERYGWQLSVTQNNQFRNSNGDELIGATMSFSNQQLVTAQGGNTPELQQTNPVTLLPKTKRILLMAQGNEGTGTWIYRFGDAQTADKSIALHVPGGANPEVTTYSTTLTWELGALPTN
ncbi:WxL domain-containing protein [Enterococcus mundtii]|uniref:WxL domain-containing protein n=1 Tax=Enterococcus mundtii TaxID=53346 RepID=UPI0013772E59|nr:WxL domain-containing protein [Enterococcus mundtii]NBA63577.1 BspA family leucine-rich repeat surface protein [Enterococcus mundtii]